MAIEEKSGADPERAIELQEWRESLDYVLAQADPQRVRDLLEALWSQAQAAGVEPTAPGRTTGYVNTIAARDEADYPGDLALEAKIDAHLRWNAAAMVVRANRKKEGIGGHLASYASIATLYEVGFNHAFVAAVGADSGDQVFFQGHSAPGIYARAFLEGRLTETQLANFRRELATGGGLSSYPHPWLMPAFWQFPTVSMGLGPLMAVYQARFNRYLSQRGLKDTSHSRVWAFLGDGETDEPEALSAIRLASREHLNNLTFVVNCNLQRLDGPVRGNGKVVQELEGLFAGAGWRVIKVLWSRAWDPLFARDHHGDLAARLAEITDGEYQQCLAGGPSVLRQVVFNTPATQRLIAGMDEAGLAELIPGGLDPVKVYSAYRAAMDEPNRPTVILAQTVKGYRLGSELEARNLTHDQKKISAESLIALRDRLGLEIPDQAVTKEPPFVPLVKGSKELAYLQARRQALGGSLPARRPFGETLPEAEDKVFSEFDLGSDRPVSTTMATVRLLTNLLRDPGLGARVVPIVPDEARTFGMESLFRMIGIYNPDGQRYQPVDAGTLLPYREAKNGQLLEEGINEAGAMASFIAAATSGITHQVATIPFYWFYSQFGLQRIGDLVWAAGEMRSRGFLLAGLSGRTQLQGEGLQHQDGGSHLLAMQYPTLEAYDPAFAYEAAVVIKDGLRRMLKQREMVFYYLTLGNETYPQPHRPKGVSDQAILAGLYLYATEQAPAKGKAQPPRVQIMAQGVLIHQAIAAQGLLKEQGVSSEVLSMPSIKALHRDASDQERLRLLGEPTRPSHLAEVLGDRADAVVAVSDYVRALPDSLGRWVKAPFATLGTDGFGRSEGHEELRTFFEVDGAHIAYASLALLVEAGKLDKAVLKTAKKAWQIDTKAAHPRSR
ncbi:MAG: pyruvate dehydrogenase (acetyl-transferring), homodimeric type [Sulfobacillus sp.]